MLAYHVVELGQWHAVPNAGFGYLLRHGWAGVDLFFVVSGFVITLSAVHGWRRDAGGFRGPFAARRLTRIVPLYLLTCALFVLLVTPQLLLAPVALAIHGASHLLFVHNLHPATSGSINGPTWSVALEMQFYLFVLLATPWLARVRIAWFLVAATSVALCWRLGVALGPGRGLLDGRLQFFHLTQLPGVIDEFALGMALALALERGAGPVARWLQPRTLHAAGWAVLAAALLAGAVALDLARDRVSDAVLIVLWRSLIAGGFAALLAAAVAWPAAGHGLLAPLRWLGDVSYGIYLWHMLVLLALLRAGVPAAGGRLLAATVLGTVLLAALTWHLLEKPTLQKYNNRLSGAPA